MREMSLCVSDVMTEIGVTEEIVSARRKMFLREETVDSFCCKLLGYDCSYYYFGSQSEGTTTMGLHSDIDQLRCRKDRRIISDLKHWSGGGRRNLLLVKDQAAVPGYRSLIPLHTDRPEYLTEVPDGEDSANYWHGDDGVLYLLHTHLHRKDPGGVMHGPAWSSKGSGGWPDEDWINAYHIHHWPEEAVAWQQRTEGKTWPTVRMKERIVSSGSFVVPVGYHDTTGPALHYRLSTTLGERVLMLSLNITQVRCLVILKMLIKTHITNVYEDSIKSFYCKTALFYVSEERADCAEFWCEENIVTCIICCLEWLYEGVKCNNMPNYFVPSLNMFEDRLDVDTRAQVATLLKQLIDEPLQAMLAIEYDDVGQRLYKRLCQGQIYTVRTLPTNPRSITTAMDLGSAKDNRKMIAHFLSNLYIDNFPFDYNLILKESIGKDFDSQVQSLEKCIAVCNRVLADCAEENITNEGVLVGEDKVKDDSMRLDDEIRLCAEYVDPRYDSVEMKSRNDTNKHRRRLSGDTQNISKCLESDTSSVSSAERNNENNVRTDGGISDTEEIDSVVETIRVDADEDAEVNVRVTSLCEHVETLELDQSDVGVNRLIVAGGIQRPTPSILNDLTGEISQLEGENRFYITTVVRRVKTLMFSFLGVMRASQEIYKGQSLSDKTQQLLKYGCQSDITSGRLKYATALYSFGDIVRARCVLENIDASYDRNSMMPVCLCYRRTKVYAPKEGFVGEVIDHIHTDTMQNYCAFCVVFTHQEAGCVPEELKREVFRVKEHDENDNKSKLPWMDWACVDSLPYLYFMLYMAHRQVDAHVAEHRSILGETTIHPPINHDANIKSHTLAGANAHFQQKRNQALVNFAWCIENENLNHRETALNLLGQCLQMENRLNEAKQCYVDSLEHRSTCNVAKSLLQELVVT